jgi:glycosyltransferase involved in cell wall biosynthesis
VTINFPVDLRIMDNKVNKIIVFIPVFRCEAQIKRVLSQFDATVQELIDTVFIVDNRSPDDTLSNGINFGSQILTKSNFVVWQNKYNYGLGGSHKVAFRYATEHNFDYLIVLHGDDQADIRDIIPFLKMQDFAAYDCLLGARFMDGSHLSGYSWLRTFGNQFYNLLFSLVLGKRVKDLGSGLNLYKVSTFKNFYYKLFPDDLTFNYVMLVASYTRKHKILYFPISWREEDQISNVRLFRQAIKVLRLLTSYALSKTLFLQAEMREHSIDLYTGETVFYQKNQFN